MSCEHDYEKLSKRIPILRGYSQCKNCKELRHDKDGDIVSLEENKEK
jgi:hypothetical protein